MSKLNFNEEIFLLLYFSDNNTSLKTRLMKLLFLFEKFFEVGEGELEFTPHHFGPWAGNFTELISPLILSESLAQKNLDYGVVFSFYDNKKQEFIRFLKSKYVEDRTKTDCINLLEFFVTKYPTSRTQDLIQLIYILFPEFTEKSKIMTQILNEPRTYNRYVIQEFMERAPKQFYMRLFKDRKTISNLLKFFEIIEGERDFFVGFLELIHVPMFSEFPTSHRKTLLDFLYSYNNLKLYAPINLALSSLLINLESELDVSGIQKTTIFCFQALDLKWPLDTQSFNNFNDLVSILLSKIDTIPFLKGIDPLGEIEISRDDTEYNSTKRKSQFEKIFKTEEIQDTLLALEPEELEDQFPYEDYQS